MLLYIEISVIFVILIGSFVVSFIEKRKEKKEQKRIFQKEDPKQKSTLDLGREQFKKLISKNLSIPVTLL